MENKNLDVNYNFQEARKLVKIWFDLNLSLIEQVELRKIVKQTTNSYVNDKENYSKKYDRHTINPSLEAMFIFMNQNYKTKIEHHGQLYEMRYNRNKHEGLVGIDNYLDKYKIMQEEKHLL